MDLRRHDHRSIGFGVVLCRQDRGRAAVPEQGRSHHLRPLIVRADAGEEAGDALCRHHQTLLARLVPKGLRGKPEQGDRTCAADSQDVVLVGRRIHLVVVDQLVGKRGPTERVVGARDDGADVPGVQAKPVHRPQGEAEQLLLRPRRALLEARTKQLRRELEARLLTPQRAKIRSANSSLRAPARRAPRLGRTTSRGVRAPPRRLAFERDGHAAARRRLRSPHRYPRELDMCALVRSRPFCGAGAG